ncbi:MAG: FmdB family transcriptional regulator [Coriobacteriia bacterium]|nr:FmdB family transcriptional regulator [Coriobacteriia bacterium]
MTRYDYRCTACAESFEISKPMGKTDDEQCPVCGASAKRIYSAAAIAFKGSGFHNTDYRSQPKDGQSHSDSAPGCPAESGTGSCASCPAATG